ncbi:UDP-N-acetylenolpyruvoylglucosamine reductase [Gammaproteobacteria bacterium]
MSSLEQRPLRGELRRNEPLSGYTTWRVGGPADQLYSPADVADLAAFMAQLPEDEPLLWLGLGSNLLVRDAGFRGTVIALHGALAEVERLSGSRVQAGAGVACARLARLLVRQQLTGGEFLGGIPGTLGGALAMNAGAFGGQTWELVEEVTTIDRVGRLRTRTPADFRVSYREVRPATVRGEEWFIAAMLHLQPAADDAGAERIRTLLERRSRTQPIGMASAGSTFRNPEGDYAARLIEASGLKGLREGGACVSSMHANFIINTGNATAADIERLIYRIQSRVEELHGVHLVTEIHVVGEPSP